LSTLSPNLLGLIKLLYSQPRQAFGWHARQSKIARVISAGQGESVRAEESIKF